MQSQTPLPLMLHVKDVMMLLDYTSYSHAHGIIKEVKVQLNINRKIRGITIREFCSVYKLDESEVTNRLAQYMRA